MDQNQLQQAALDFLRSVIADESGVGLLYGPKLSGKSDVIERFVRECRDDFAIAVVDGSRLKTSQLLAQIIVQFGYGVQLDTNDELLSMLRVIMVQQTRSYKAPVLVVKNINKMYPSALCVLCNLASQKIHGRFALRIVLVGERYFRRIMNTPSMRPITDRLVGGFELRASQQPRFPKLIVTLEGKTLQDIELKTTRALIGRVELADVVCDGEFVSRQHALLIRDQDDIVLVDLRSKNGTYVNSHRVTSKALRDGDIIAIGNFRLKLDYAAANAHSELGELDAADTAKMKSIGDAREAQASMELADPTELQKRL